MSKHLYGMILTHHGIAANNRGQTEGNITTLQKLLWNGDIYTTVSAEAIKFGMRYYFQKMSEMQNDNSAKYLLNRTFFEDEIKKEYSLKWKDEKWDTWEKMQYLDDDLLGFMTGEARKTENNEITDEEDEEHIEDSSEIKGKTQKKNGPKGRSYVRKARLEIARAISLTPYSGDITFGSKSGIKDSTSIFNAEVHATCYQYGFSLTPSHLKNPKNALLAIEGIENLFQVGGNHSRFLFDFSPETIIYRWTDDFAPRYLYCFESNENGYNINKLINKFINGDILPEEIVIGGMDENHPNYKILKDNGVTIYSGIKHAGRDISDKILKSL